MLHNDTCHCNFFSHIYLSFCRLIIAWDCHHTCMQGILFHYPFFSHRRNAISCLQEPDPQIQSYALKYINNHVTENWSRTSLLLGVIEQLYEDPMFPNRGVPLRAGVCVCFSSSCSSSLFSFYNHKVMLIQGGKTLHHQTEAYPFFIWPPYIIYIIYINPQRAADDWSFYFAFYVGPPNSDSTCFSTQLAGVFFLKLLFFSSGKICFDHDKLVPPWYLIFKKSKIIPK